MYSTLRSERGEKVKRYLVVSFIFTMLFLYGSFSYSGNMGNFGNQLLQSGKQMLQEKATKNTPLEKLPDLTVTKIVKIKNKPLIVNDNRQGFVVFIKNTGSKDVRGQYIYVKFTYGNKTIIKKFYGLAMNHTKELKVAPVVFDKGGKNYSITAEVDYDNKIKEQNENNNKLSKTFYVDKPFLIIKNMKAQLGKNGKNMYVIIEINKGAPVDYKNITELKVYDNVHHSYAYHHMINRTTYVFGPVDYSNILTGINTNNKIPHFNSLGTSIRILCKGEIYGQMHVVVGYTIKIMSQKFTRGKK